MLRVAVIGCGNIGRTHAGVYREHPRVRLVACCDVVKEKADAFAGQFGLKAYYDVAALLAREELDAVSVTTAGPENGGHHYEPVMRALDAGKAVLCEKPLSNEIAKAREMVAAAKSRDLYLGVNLNHRFSPIADRAKALIQSGDLGELLLVNMALWIRNPNETSPWFHLRALHPHSVDVMRHFCGDVKRVQAFLSHGPLPDGGRRKCWSNASINMEFANGVVGHLSGSYDMATIHPFERCEVAGSKGRFVIDNVYERLSFYPHASAETMVISNSIMGGTYSMASFRDTFKHRIFKFVDQIEQRVPLEDLDAAGEAALAAQEVIEAAIRSWEERTIVDL